LLHRAGKPDKMLSMSFRWTRELFLRALGFLYAVAFISLAWQLIPLLGSDGVLPASAYLHRLRAAGAGFWYEPTIFWWGVSDGTLHLFCGLGVALSLALLAGLQHVAVLFLLWAIYMSFVHVGQIFYGYGWEILLLEAGFLAIFLGSVRTLKPTRCPSPIPIFLLRWLLFRVLLGAGLIKLRGDQCWRDFTCLVYHYETQPIPNPLSWLIHQAPPWFHMIGVGYNHLVEVIVPFFLFWPKRVARIAGLLEAAFQIMLILSGNLSWLNWLTLALCIPCFDDEWLVHLIPRRWRNERPACAKLDTRVAIVLALVIGVLSIRPMMNLTDPAQKMNYAFDPLSLVNTYGAFGTIGRERPEVILEGSDDGVTWLPYELPCKPGDPMRRPCVIAPFQPRLDWQIWFAAMSEIQNEPWLVRVVEKLLDGHAPVLRLFAYDPFHGRAPKYVRAELYEYRFTHFGEPGWWKRRRLGEYMPPLQKGDPVFDAVAPDDDAGF
jgi:hypothetical protein